MTSLVVLAWMSLTSAVLHLGASGPPAEPWMHLAVQVLALLAMVVEAGSLESGRPSRWRRPTQALVLFAFVAYLGASHWHLLGPVFRFLKDLAGRAVG